MMQAPPAHSSNSTLCSAFGLCLALCACSGLPTKHEQGEPTVALPAWVGQSASRLQERMGLPDSRQSFANGHGLLRYRQTWVLGAGGERYRIAQNDYPLRSAGAPGGFNAKLLSCDYLFEWGPDQTLSSAKVSDLHCPVPSPSPS